MRRAAVAAMVFFLSLLVPYEASAVTYYPSCTVSIYTGKTKWVWQGMT